MLNNEPLKNCRKRILNQPVFLNLRNGSTFLRKVWRDIIALMQIDIQISDTQYIEAKLFRTKLVILEMSGLSYKYYLLEIVSAYLCVSHVTFSFLLNRSECWNIY